MNALAIHHRDPYDVQVRRRIERDSFTTPPPISRTTPTRRDVYTNYLRSPQWQHTRQQALERAQYRCSLCNSTSRLNVHHRTYTNLGREQPADLTVLCEPCHELFHQHRRLR